MLQQLYYIPSLENLLTEVYKKAGTVMFSTSGLRIGLPMQELGEDVQSTSTFSVIVPGVYTVEDASTEALQLVTALPEVDMHVIRSMLQQIIEQVSGTRKEVHLLNEASQLLEQHKSKSIESVDMGIEMLQDGVEAPDEDAAVFPNSEAKSTNVAEVVKAVAAAPKSSRRKKTSKKATSKASAATPSVGDILG